MTGAGYRPYPCQTNHRSFCCLFPPSTMNQRETSLFPAAPSLREIPFGLRSRLRLASIVYRKIRLLPVRRRPRPPPFPLESRTPTMVGSMAMAAFARLDMDGLFSSVWKKTCLSTVSLLPCTCVFPKGLSIARGGLGFSPPPLG